MGLTRITSDGITDGTISTADLADQSVTLAKLPHGTSSNNGKFLRANNGADPTFETINSFGTGSLVGDQSPQLGGDLQSNGNDVDFADDDKAIFGTGGDFKIYHTATNDHSIIEETGGGNLVVRTNGSHIEFDKGSSEFMARMLTDGAVELYHDGTKKFETTSAGVTVTGQVTSSTLTLSANAPRITFTDLNDNPDFEIHGNSGALTFFDATNSANRLIIQSDGTVDVTGNLGISDNSKVLIGSGDDLQLYHDGSNSYIDDAGTGALNIRTNNSNINFKGGGSFAHDLAIFKSTEGVELFYNNSKKFETLSNGVKANGNVLIPDGYQIRFGDGNDFQIYHDGTDSIITNSTGDLQITDTSDDITITAADDIRLRPQGGENGINILGDGAVELYHNNVKKLNTFDSGVVVSGDIQIYDNSEIQMGNSSDFKIFFNGTNGIIKAGTGVQNINVWTENTAKYQFTSGAIRPLANNSYDLGDASLRWRDIYTNDLNLSNEGGANDVDGTWGSYTIQEGAEDLFLVNKRNGKKYKFNLTEVS